MMGAAADPGLKEAGFMPDSRFQNPKMNTRAVDREILLSFWKVHILYHASEKAIHGQWILTELRRHGYKISHGTLFPLLARMHRLG